MRRGAWLVWTALVACSWDARERGEACARTSECAAGLACIEGECGDDLGAIEDPGEVPVLVEDAASDEVAADASDGATPASDGGR